MSTLAPRNYVKVLLKTLSHTCAHIRGDARFTGRQEQIDLFLISK